VIVAEQHDHLRAQAVDRGHHRPHAGVVRRVQPVVKVGQHRHPERREPRPRDGVARHHQPPRLHLPGVEPDPDGQRPRGRARPAAPHASLPSRGRRSVHRATLNPARALRSNRRDRASIDSLCHHLPRGATPTAAGHVRAAAMLIPSSTLEASSP
ncbi:MAG: hypothetical protein ACK56F_28450, partial [bacterium]